MKGIFRNSSTQSYIEIDDKEEEVRVLYEFQPAEPDVGIMRSYIEIVGVYAREKDPVKLIRNRILGIEEDFVVDVSNKVDSETFADQIEEELNAHGDYY